MYKNVKTFSWGVDKKCACRQKNKGNRGTERLSPIAARTLKCIQSGY
jgi:hypothetical protein